MQRIGFVEKKSFLNCLNFIKIIFDGSVSENMLGDFFTKNLKSDAFP